MIVSLCIKDVQVSVLLLTNLISLLTNHCTKFFKYFIYVKNITLKEKLKYKK